ncbi:MAG: FkbM family methyltransferase [Thermoleophilaceae bacterium]|nr:FkbM family methyltransferase [Thermoleophilaceae bacterium]
MINWSELAGKSRMHARAAANRFGYDVHKIDPVPDLTPARPPTTLPTAEAGTARLMQQTRPRAVIDVGANVGQFASWVRASGFTGPIISFEPQPDEHAELLRASENDPDWTIVPRVAVGSADGAAQIHLAGNSQSSSLLKMLDLHVVNAPDSAYVGTVETPVRRLDDLLAEADFDPTDALLKVDTQGYEHEVLRGAPDTLGRISSAMLELSLAPLYDGQALASNLFTLLGSAGLELSMLIGCFNSGDGEILQCDGAFTRLLESEKLEKVVDLDLSI